MLRVHRVKAEGPGLTSNVAGQKNKQKKKKTGSEGCVIE